MDKAMECVLSSGQTEAFLMKLSLPFIVLTFVVGCILLPMLLKNLKGHSKAYMILQQLTIVMYLVFSFAPLMIANHIDTRVQAADLHVFFKNRHLYIVTYICNIFKGLFCYENQFFMILQCANYHKMICDGFQFEAYKKPRKVMVRVIRTFLLSMLLVVDDIVTNVVTAFMTFPNRFASSGKYMITVVQKIQVFGMCELLLFRFIVLSALLKMGFDIKRSLASAKGVRDGDDGRKPLLIVVVVFPLINAFVCNAVEMTAIIIPASSLAWSEVPACSHGSELFRNQMMIPLLSSAYLMATISTCCAYLVAFPKLRKNLCFKQD